MMDFTNELRLSERECIQGTGRGRRPDVLRAECSDPRGRSCKLRAWVYTQRLALAGGGAWVAFHRSPLSSLTTYSRGLRPCSSSSLSDIESNHAGRTTSALHWWQHRASSPLCAGHGLWVS